MPVLIGAFGIPQIISVLKDRMIIGEAKKFQRVLPEFHIIVKQKLIILQLIREVKRVARSYLLNVIMKQKGATGLDGGHEV